MLTAAKDEMIAEHKQECFRALQEIRRSHDACWAEIRQLRLKRRSEQQERAQANLEKNRERLEKTLEALRYFQECAQELREKIASAWNEDWKLRASKRLTEIEAKILDIESSITKIEGWIAEDEGKAKSGSKPEAPAKEDSKEEPASPVEEGGATP